MPFQVDDIYLKDNKKEIKAVCSNNTIAKFLAECVNAFSITTTNDLNRAKKYKDFITAAYYLDKAITKANIPITTLETMVLEKAYNVFKEKLKALLTVDDAKIDWQEQTTSVSCN